MSLLSHFKIIGSSWRSETKRRQSLSGRRRRGSETQFLPEALEIVETPPSPFGRLILWVIMGAYVLAITWSIFGRIDIVATAQGRIIPKGQTQVVEAPETGVVKKINVRNGAKVKAGDILLELDATIADADTESVDHELKQAETRAAIAKGIIHYLDYGAARFVRPEGVSNGVASVSRRQLDSRIQAYKAERMLLTEERIRLLASREGVTMEIAKIKDTMPLTKSRMESYQKLAAEGLAPQIEAMRLEEEMIEREQDLQIAKGRIKEADSSIMAADRRMLLLSRELRRDALSELAEAEAIKSNRTEALKKAEIRNSWQIIRAPVDGTIVGSQVFTIGDVIEPGAPLMMIAPLNEDLIVEAMILNKDIGFVREGDQVAVKLEAYPFTRYGLIDGELSMISADAQIDERLGPVFLVEVKLAHPYVGEGDLKRDIQAGMNATAEVKTGDRRIIDFILSPIAKASKEAARER